LDAIADFALNQRWKQGTLGVVDGGFDALDLQESQEAIGYW
jgi:hypothetical protein